MQVGVNNTECPQTFSYGSTLGYITVVHLSGIFHLPTHHGTIMKSNHVLFYSCTFSYSDFSFNII